MCVRVHAYVYLFTYGHVCVSSTLCMFVQVRNVYISLYVCVGGGTCTMIFCSPYFQRVSTNQTS